MDNNHKSWYRRYWGVALLLFLVLSFASTIALGIAVIKILKNPTIRSGAQAVKTIKPESIEQIEGKNSFWIGAAKPRIVIVEFGDFSCPICKKSFPKIRELSQKYQDRVKFIFRDFPVVSERSVELSLAANCAGAQGLFWPMHDKLFLNQGKTSDESLKELASEIGLDLKRFNDCYDRRVPMPKIRQDATDGEALGVKGTPTYFINGRMIAGDLPYEMLENVILSMQ